MAASSDAGDAELARAMQEQEDLGAFRGAQDMDIGAGPMQSSMDHDDMWGGFDGELPLHWLWAFFSSPWH